MAVASVATPTVKELDTRFRELAELAFQEKQSRGVKASSLRADRVRLGVLHPLIGHLKLSELTPRALAHALAEIAASRQLSAASFNRYHALVSSVFAHAVREEILQVNPMGDGRVRRRAESKVHPRYLERDEQRQVLRHLEAPKRDEVELATTTGMRRGEQYNARWADWKKKEGVLYVSGKTGPRPVRINQAARRCLSRMKRRARPEAIFITPERNADPIDRRRWFEKAVKKARLSSKFRWHDLRHTFASRLVAAGVPLLDVQKLCGHASFATTLRYAHLSSDHVKRAVEKVRF